jgi:hypothetical protein
VFSEFELEKIIKFLENVFQILYSRENENLGGAKESWG